MRHSRRGAWWRRTPWSRAGPHSSQRSPYCEEQEGRVSAGGVGLGWGWRTKKIKRSRPAGGGVRRRRGWVSPHSAAPAAVRSEREERGAVTRGVCHRRRRGGKGRGGKEPAARRPQRPQRTRERASRGGRRRETRASAPAQPVPPRNTSATPAPSVPPPRSPSSAPRARGARCGRHAPPARARARRRRRPLPPPDLSCGLAEARARGKAHKSMRRGVRQTARAGEVKSNRIRAKQTAGSVRFARGCSGYFRPRRLRRGALREGA